MKFASIGTRGASKSFPGRRPRQRSGFTLLEALVALTIVLAFAAVLGPFLFQARRVMLNADGRVAAQLLLRALLQDPLDRAGLANLSRDGESAGLRWHLVAEPTSIGAMFAPRDEVPRKAGATPAEPQRNWTAYRIVASVSWAPGQSISAETVRLGESGLGNAE
jgi:prepilin-type N-terminal cleavage/methylation domain-containing protein